MMERRWILAVAASLLATVTATDGWAQATASDLDAVAQRTLAQERVAGASILVVQRGKVILHKGYGHADVGLEAPAKDETVYHVVGPMLPFTGIAVMQLVERGKLSLDDDIFPACSRVSDAGPSRDDPAAAESHIGDRRLSLPG